MKLVRGPQYSILCDDSLSYKLVIDGLRLTLAEFFVPCTHVFFGVKIYISNSLQCGNIFAAQSLDNADGNVGCVAPGGTPSIERQRR